MSPTPMTPGRRPAEARVRAVFHHHRAATAVTSGGVVQLSQVGSQGSRSRVTDDVKT